VSTNTAVGASALAANEAGGNNNTAVGYESLNANTTGDFNTALGSGALDANTTASNNTAVGYQAGYSQTTGGTSAGYNAYFGQSAGYASTGYQNTLIGRNAGSAITTGNANTILGQYNGNQDGLDIRTADNYAVISDGDGNRLLTTANGQTLALDGGAVPNAGTGITFPATQAASANANTLDDYEEGTFDVSVTFGGASAGITYSVRNFAYVKIGNTVYITGYVNLTNKGSSTGGAAISGLPFTSAAGNATYSAFSLHIDSMTFGGFPNGFIGPSSSGISLFEITDAGVGTAITNADFTNTTGLIISGFYRT
jgi:hypothetical protein